MAFFDYALGQIGLIEFFGPGNPVVLDQSRPFVVHYFDQIEERKFLRSVASYSVSSVIWMT